MAERLTTSLGLLGKYYSVRHSLGHYRSAGVTATYCISAPNVLDPVPWLRSTFEKSLQATISEHPGLCYGIDDRESGLAPGFKQLSEIQRDDVVRYLANGDAEADGDTTDLLHREVERAHAELWVANKPAWRTIVAYEHYQACNGSGHAPAAPHLKLHVAFLAHHAIADGLSGMAFHTSLMDHFQQTYDNNLLPGWPLSFPHTIQAPQSLDSLLEGLDSSSSLDETQNTDPPVWAGGVTSLPSITEFRSRIRLVEIPQEKLRHVLQECKKSGITLTGLLHGLICTTLRRNLKDSPGFRAVTPYSTRRFTRASQRDILNHISYMTHYVPGAQLDEIQASEPQSAVESQHIIKLASDFSRNMDAEMRRFPDGTALADLRRIKDLEAHCTTQMGMARGYTYELSNLGSLRASDTAVPTPIALERLIFTQCGMVAGPALGFSCVSVQGGPLMISITWQHGIVDEQLVENVAQDIERRLAKGVDGFTL